MKITERRLRQIIRSVIEESIKAESLDLSALAAAGLISSKEKSRIENEINEDISEGLGTVGKIGGIVAGAILALTISLDISSNMEKTRIAQEKQRQIDVKALKLAAKSEKDLQGAYNDYKKISAAAMGGDQEAAYQLDMIHDGLNACTQYKIQRSRDFIVRDGPQRYETNNPGAGLYKGYEGSTVDRINMSDDPEYSNVDEEKLRRLCYRFSDAIGNTDTYLMNNPGAFNP